MNDFLVVQVVDCHNQLNRIEYDGLFLELFLRLEDLVKLTTLNKWHDEVEPHVVLEQEVHLYEERVVALEKNVLLAQRILDLIVFY